MTTAEKVATRYLNSKTVTSTIIYRDCGDIHWGWFPGSNIQRMHLTPIKPVVYQGLCTIWLELDGVRCFEVEGGEMLVLGPVQGWMQHNRDRVECAWLDHCRSKDWIRQNATRTEVVLYPGRGTRSNLSQTGQVTSAGLEPLFPTVDDVLELHAQQLELFGGSAGLRDLGALASAVPG